MQKSILSLFLLLFSIATFWEAKAQSPEKMSYQAVVRDGSGALIKSMPVGFKFSIIQYAATGTTVYEETQTITTNTNGVATAIIGNGTIVSGTMSSINWSDGPYFIKVDSDPTGGSSYSISNTTQLLSVPYALYAKTSGRDSVVYAKYSGRDSVVYAATSGRDSVIYAKYSGRDSVMYAATSGRDSVVYAKYSGRDSVKYAATSGRDSVIYAKFSGSTLVDTFNWHLKGNSGTNPDSNFIGTIDNKDVIFKRGGSFAGIIAGSNNSFGSQAFPNYTTGFYNSAFGGGALSKNKSTLSMGNTAMGYFALSNDSVAQFNTGIGAGASYAGTATSTINNSLWLGYNSGKVSSASNRAEIGNTYMTWIGGQVGWSTYSDKRIKNAIKADVPGLDFINKLRPVTYYIDAHRQQKMLEANGVVDTAQWPEKYDIEKKRQTGFIAQEVAEAAKAAGYDFSGVEIPKNDRDLYSVRYADFVMPLVKAVQEQQAEIEAQKELIKKLELRLSALENKK